MVYGCTQHTEAISLQDQRLELQTSSGKYYCSGLCPPLPPAPITELGEVETENLMDFKRVHR